MCFYVHLVLTQFYSLGALFKSRSFEFSFQLTGALYFVRSAHRLFNVNADTN